MTPKKIEIIKGKIIYLEYPTQKELLSTFLRFQEHYESPKFRNTFFTLQEFKDWYKKSKGAKKFTYYTDWSGCNVPSEVFYRFKEYSEKNPFFRLSKREKNLLYSTLRKEMTNNKELCSFYVIAGYKGKNNQEVLRHEICHGLYYSYPRYRRNVTKIIERHLKELIPLFNREIINMGYHPSVCMDEIQAYVATSDIPWFIMHDFDPKDKRILKAQKLILKEVKKFLPEKIHKKYFL